MKYVYIHGPSWLGSWEGQSTLDICSGITKVDASHWTLMPNACNDLINRKVHAGLVGIYVISGIVCTWSVLQGFLQGYCNATTHLAIVRALKESH